MREAKEPTQEPNWILSHEGYKVLNESAIEYLRENAGTELDIDPNSVVVMRIAGLGAFRQAVMLGFVVSLRGAPGSESFRGSRPGGKACLLVRVDAREAGTMRLV